MTKILLVENNEMIREMISRWLVLWSYEVVLAVDGEDAINKAHSDKPDMTHFNTQLPMRLQS
jgi:two-component system response regulator